MKIVLYDEEKNYPATKEALELIAGKRGVDIDIACFAESDACYNYIINNTVDLLLTETFMPGEHGTALAKRLRNSAINNLAIIFLPVSNDYAAESYEVRACNYLLKPCNTDRLEKALEKCGLFAKEQFIYLADGKNSLKLKTQDIVAVEALGKHCVVYAGKQKHEIYNQISKIAAVLPADIFWQVHRSYLINVRHIQKQQNYDFIMDNGLAVPIRRSKFSEIKKAYTEL